MSPLVLGRHLGLKATWVWLGWRNRVGRILPRLGNPRAFLEKSAHPSWPQSSWGILANSHGGQAGGARKGWWETGLEVSAGPLVQSSRCATTTGAALGFPPLLSQLPLRFREKPMILGTSDTASLPGQHQHQPTAGSRAKWAQRARLLVQIREKVRSGCSGPERVCLVLETTLLHYPGSRNAGWLRLAGAQHVRWGSPRNPPPASRVARGLWGRRHTVPGNRASLQQRSARPWGEGSHLPARQLQQLALHSWRNPAFDQTFWHLKPTGGKEGARDRRILSTAKRAGP